MTKLILWMSLTVLILGGSLVAYQKLSTAETKSERPIAVAPARVEKGHTVRSTPDGPALRLDRKVADPAVKALRVRLANDPAFGAIVVDSEYQGDGNPFLEAAPSISNVAFVECMRHTAYAWNLGEPLSGARDEVAFSVATTYDPSEEHQARVAQARACLEDFEAAHPSVDVQVALRENEGLIHCMDSAMGVPAPMVAGDEKAMEKCIEAFRSRHPGESGDLPVDDDLRRCAAEAGYPAALFSAGSKVQMR